MSRKPMIVGNWKMNKTPAEAAVLAQSISNNFDDRYDNVDVVVCPPTIDLRSVVTVLDFDKSDIALGAQNVFWEPSGAYTGETSIPMLRDVGATYCIVGHSERREIFAETDEMIRKKAQALVATRMIPIICVGESLATREAGNEEIFVCDQVRVALAGMSANDVEHTVIA
ncbi:MAG: triosephosphate isomerase, partial [Eggerthellaceae bacterium]|nr:triosephosphate isomerase [Eggerthellaceae bacterium]